MQEKFLNDAKQMVEEYSTGRRYLEIKSYKDAAQHYVKAIQFSGDNGINYDNFKTYYDLGIILCSTGDYQGAEYCYSVAVYLDKELQKIFKELSTKFDDIANLENSEIKQLIISRAWQIGHAHLDNSDEIKKFPKWEQCVLAYRNYIKIHRDQVPFSYPDRMISIYPKEIVDFYMKAGIKLAENAMYLDKNEVEDMVDYIISNSIQSSSNLVSQARLGNPKAQLELGNRYLTGKGVIKDENRAVKWICEAAKQGLDKAQIQLGDIYYNGKVVPQNRQVAYFWYAEAYNQGNMDAKSKIIALVESSKSFAFFNSGQNNSPSTKLLIELMCKRMTDQTSKEEKDANQKTEEKTLIEEEKGTNQKSEEKTLIEEGKDANQKPEERSIIEREKDLINAGIKEKRAGNFEKSIEYYKEAVHLSPTNGNSYYALGKVLYLGGHYEEAFKAYLLAYLHNANCLKMDLFIHSGHAILDAENSKKAEYGMLIKGYIASIQGKFPEEAFSNRIESMQFLTKMNEYQDYMDMCETKGKEEILRQAKIHARE